MSVYSNDRRVRKKGVLDNESDHVINNGKYFHARKMSLLEYQYFYCTTGLQSTYTNVDTN